jgi:hypothetical protein
MTQHGARADHDGQMPESARLGRGVPWAGLAAGPAAWGAAFQASYAFADWQCAHTLHPTPWLLALALTVALAGALLTWPALSEGPSTTHTRRFLAWLSLLTALLFALVIALQLVAALIFTGCER